MGSTGMGSVKQYQVIREFATANSKPHIFDTLEDAVKQARKMNKTGKTKARIHYGIISNGGYSVQDAVRIDYEEE